MNLLKQAYDIADTFNFAMQVLVRLTIFHIFKLKYPKALFGSDYAKTLLLTWQCFFKKVSKLEILLQKVLV